MNHDMSRDLKSFCINDKYVTCCLASDVEKILFGADANAFRFSCYGNKRDDLSAGCVEHGGGTDIFVCDVNSRSVRIKAKLLGVGTRWNFTEKHSVFSVNNTYPVCGFVRQNLGVIVVTIPVEDRISLSIKFWRRFDGGSAERYIYGFPIWTGMDSTRTLANRNCGDDVEICAADDGETPGFFVGNENLIIVGCSGDVPGNCQYNNRANQSGKRLEGTTCFHIQSKYQRVMKAKPKSIDNWIKDMDRSGMLN